MVYNDPRLSAVHTPYAALTLPRKPPKQKSSKAAAAAADPAAAAAAAAAEAAADPPLPLLFAAVIRHAVEASANKAKNNQNKQTE